MPPKAATYRTKLANGSVAYLVPDRTTPLVTIHVLMRMGPQLDPAGKEGLAAMCGNLLTRSGTVITLTMWNTMPTGPVACTAIYGYMRHTVPLGAFGKQCPQP